MSIDLLLGGIIDGNLSSFFNQLDRETRIESDLVRSLALLRGLLTNDSTKAYKWSVQEQTMAQLKNPEKPSPQNSGPVCGPWVFSALGAIQRAVDVQIDQFRTDCSRVLTKRPSGQSVCG